MIDLSEHLYAIATKRHLLYIIACTPRHHKQHFHVRIAGMLPAWNKMLGAFRVVDPSACRAAQMPCAFRRAGARSKDSTFVYR